MRSCTWGEICSLEYGKAIRDYPAEPSEDMPFRVYGTNGPIGWTAKPLTEQAGIIVGRKGAYRGVHFSPEPFFVIDTAYYVRLKDDIDMKWAYYKLLTVDINRIDVGAAIPTTSRNAFYTVPLQVPSKATQQRIASTLSTYDDLIENNRRRMALLEDAARQVYQEWFVRLRFPGREHTRIVDGVPEGWEKGNVGCLTEVKSGYAFKSSDWQSEGHPVIKIANITGDNNINIDDCQCVDDNVAEKAGKYSLNMGDLLIAMTGATVGKIGIVPRTKNTYYLNQRVGRFSSKVDIDVTPFLLPFFNTDGAQAQILNYAVGAAQPNISGGQIESIKLLLPSIKLLRLYLEYSSPLFEQRINLVEQNQKLRIARDLLLPKLMCGEISV
jgi:type I restriction enzyme S subunit